MNIETREFASLGSVTKRVIPDSIEGCDGVHYNCSLAIFGDHIGRVYRNLSCNKVRLDPTNTGGKSGLTAEEHRFLHHNNVMSVRPSDPEMEAARALHIEALALGARCPNCLTVEEYRATYLQVATPRSPIQSFMRAVGISTEIQAEIELAKLGISAEDAVLILKKVSTIDGMRLWLASEQSQRRKLLFASPSTLTLNFSS